MSSKTALAVLFFSTVGISTALGQGKADEKPTPAVQDFSKEAYVIEKLSTRIVEESDGSGTREHTAEIRILADAGVKAFAVLNFTYTSANETVDVDYVRVRQPDGTVIKTPDYNIQDMPADVTRSAPMYSDIHEKHVAVKGLGVGGVLEYLVRYRVVKPQVPGQFWYEQSFTKEAIVKNETLELSVPADKYLKVASPDLKPEIKNEGGRRVYVWSHSNLIVKEKDPNEIPKRIPPSPSVQVTTFASWEDIGRWYGSLQKDPLEVTPAIQAKAAELTRGLKTNDEKIRALYNFVSLQFHYIGLDFGIGRYQPHAADDVLGNGYGDCKDKHTLLAALLKAVGIDAWPALIHATRKLDPDVPSPAQFNHVITVVPTGDQMIWLDTTPEVAPYQLLLLTLRDKQALVIPSDKPPLLMTTPANPPFPGEQEFSMKGKLGTDGTFTGRAEQSYRGDVEVVLRALFRNIPQSQWKDAVQRFSYGLNFGGDVSNVTVTPPEDLEKPFGISYDYARKSYADWENHQIVLPLPPMGVEVTKDSKDRKPSEPVLLGGLGRVDYRSQLELPPGSLTTAPSNVNLVEPYAEYHTTNLLQDGVLTTTRRFEIKKNEVALNEWENFRKFGKAIGDDEFNYIRLNGAALAADGGGTGNLDETFRAGIDALQKRNFIGAEALFQKVIAIQPNYPLAHLNLGSAFLMQGNGDAALIEYHKEEEVSPDNVVAYQVSAYLFASIGRIDEAIAEWRKLLKANPKNPQGAIGLGQALSQQGKYSEAAQELEDALKLSPKSADLQFALGSAYLKLGQSETAVTHIRAAVEGSTKPEPMVLNNVAYALADGKTSLDLAQQYAENAAKQLDAQSINDAAAEDTGTRVTFQLAMIWDTLGWVYFQSGDTDRSESFVRAAWLLGQHSIVGEHLGEIYEKQGKNKQAAHTYELALAALRDVGLPMRSQANLSTPPFAPVFDENNSKDQRERILSRYKKLTGRAPNLLAVDRLPNGEWTKTPAEELSQMRASRLGKIPNLSGSAEFSIVFSPGRIESVDYLRGEESLKNLTDKLKMAHFQVEFPAGSKAKIYRRAQLSCTPAVGCMAVLVPTNTGAPP